jgi:hypothetical protein
MPSNVKLIPKMLSSHNNLEERSFYRVDDSYFTEYPLQRNSKSTLTKERSFTTSIQNIVKQFKIQNIKALICNIDIDNLDECISNANCFNHIISYICISNHCQSFHSNKSFINNLFIPSNKPFLYLPEDAFQVFEHKNLHVPLPKICLYTTENVPTEEQDKFDLLIAQYNITLLSEPNKAIEKIIQDDEIDYTLQRPKELQNFDMIIQFNPKYLSYNDFFQILYPLKDNVIYCNKEFDILYGNKNCIYMLWQILESKYFSDYLDNLKKNKKVIYKLFYKKYFHDYVSKIFNLKSF